MLAWTASIVAQTTFVPDANANNGQCNIVPFGADTTGSAFAEQRTQVLLTSAQLGGSGGLVTDLEVVPCSNGLARFGRLEIRLSSTTANALSADFDSNLVSPELVLDLHDHDWPLVKDTWNLIGLQRPFVHDAASNLVIDFRVQEARVESVGPGGNAGFRAPVDMIARAVTVGPGASSATTATIVDMNGGRVGVRFFAASSGIYGRGCAPPGGVEPVVGVISEAVLGSALGFGMFGPPSSSALLFVGISVGAPGFPLPLDGLGLSGCRLYTTPDLFQFSRMLGPTGLANVAIDIPPVAQLIGFPVYAQSVVAQPGGFAFSGYARAGIGL